MTTNKEGPEIVLELTIDPNYPTTEVPRHRFVKQLADSPWSGVIAALVELDDPAWELLGHPRMLKATIEREEVLARKGKHG